MSEVHAMTARRGIYPPYINATVDQSNLDEVKVTLRGNRQPDGSCGASVTATFTRDEWATFVESL